MTKPFGKLDHLVSLRGIAAWLVVLFHSRALLSIPESSAWFRVIAHGYLAVDFFFILSGFIIFINYHDAFAARLRQSVYRFYWNRFSRIYPVHLLMLCGYVGLAVAILFASSAGSLPPSYSLRSLLESVLLLQAWTGSDSAWNPPSWSISAEWFVYLLFPFTVTIQRKFVSTPAQHLALWVGAAVALYFCYTLAELRSLGSSFERMALVRAFWEFQIGMVIGSLFLRHRLVLDRVRWLAGSLGVLLLVVYVYANLPDFVLIPTVFSLCLACLVADRSILSKLLSTPVLVYAGEISYSTYMVHYLVYDLFKAVWVKDLHHVNQVSLFISFVVVFILSIAVHGLVEKPAQQFLRNRFFRPVGAAQPEA